MSTSTHSQQGKGQLLGFGLTVNVKHVNNISQICQCLGPRHTASELFEPLKVFRYFQSAAKQSHLAELLNALRHTLMQVIDKRGNRKDFTEEL